VEMAVNLLLRGTQAAQNSPFSWSYIDRPQEGSVHLLFLAPHMQFPADGIRYLENEQRYTMAAGNGREVEVAETKFGFFPNSEDTAAFRVRRKFKLVKGGNPQLCLVHYSKGHPMSIAPGLNTPVRSYPLAPSNQPMVYVLGEKAGQKVPVQPPQQQPAPGMGGMNYPNTAQSMLAHQNRQMEAVERRNAEQRVRSSSVNNRQNAPPQIDEQEDLDKESISTRTLALTRFRRNHEFMDEIFIQAAMGERNPPRQPVPYSIFDKSELEEKVAKITSQVGELQERLAERRAARAKLENELSLSVPVPTT